MRLDFPEHIQCIWWSCVHALKNEYLCAWYTSSNTKWYIWQIFGWCSENISYVSFFSPSSLYTFFASKLFYRGNWQYQPKTEFYRIEHLQICHEYLKYFFPTGSRISKCSIWQNSVFLRHPVAEHWSYSHSVLTFGQFLWHAACTDEVFTECIARHPPRSIWKAIAPLMKFTPKSSLFPFSPKY